MREQRAVLRDEADAALVRRHEGGAIGHGLLVQHDAAAVWRLEAGDQAQKRGLAAAGRTDDRRAGAGLDGEVDAGQRPHRPVAPGQCRKVEEAHRPAIRFDCA
jgi:hypothetical protein